MKAFSETSKDAEVTANSPLSAGKLLQSDLERLPARERILRTALILFNQKGVHRTGTDLIIEQADVAKMTFYRLFESKARLIAECLRLRDAEWFVLLRKHIDQHKGARARALALFDAFEEWFEQPDFAGCPFIRGLYDFNFEEDDKEIVAVIQSHFAATQSLVIELVKAARPKDYREIAPLFMSLLSGSIVVAQVSRVADIARINRAQAAALLAGRRKRSATRSMQAKRASKKESRRPLP
jgi:AcrR family transcriptional regulator